MKKEKEYAILALSQEQEREAVKQEIAVSVLMPSLNVANYIRECMESVTRQTLHNIEIICIDAGSTDGTLEILQEYEKRDSRVHLILSKEKSYGYQMNRGLEHATGKYIGIVETDDWAEPDMFETLFKAAERYQADMVRAGYYWYYTKPEIKNIPMDNLRGCPINQPFIPRDDNRLFYAAPAIWSGIYLRSMLEEKDLRFSETPGASYQDTSFYYTLCSIAERAVCLERNLIHYRRDNEASSVHQEGKVFTICDELQTYEKYIDSHDIEEKEALKKQYMSVKLKTYLWNYNRLAPQFQWEFLCRMSEEFQKHKEEGKLDKHVFADQAWFAPTAWDDVRMIIHRPLRYFLKSCKTNAACPYGGTLLTNKTAKKIFEKGRRLKARLRG